MKHRTFGSWFYSFRWCVYTYCKMLNNNACFRRSAAPFLAHGISAFKPHSLHDWVANLVSLVRYSRCFIFNHSLNWRASRCYLSQAYTVDSSASWWEVMNMVGEEEAIAQCLRLISIHDMQVLGNKAWIGCDFSGVWLTHWRIRLINMQVKCANLWQRQSPFDECTLHTNRARD